MIEVECDTCEGTGVIEIMNCTNGSNECCGGCYRDERCNDCNGSGFTEEEAE